MFACVLGVTRILYAVSVVVAVIAVESVTLGVSLPGFATDPYTVAPALSVISTRLSPPDVPAARVTVTAVMESVPLAVWNAKVSAMVAAPPGARFALLGSVPVASVVTFGVTGDPVGVAPVA